MRFPSLLIAGLLLGVAAVPCWAKDGPTATTQRDEVIRRYGVDPASPLESRVGETSPTVLKMFEGVRQAGQPAPTSHVLTDEEKCKLAAAFATLTPLHQRVLREHLRRVSFLDGMPNTALTSAANPDDSYKVFDITIRAGILHQNASEWMTEKERSIFAADGSPLSVSIEAGKRDAIAYVLLHEATHVVDACLGITPPFIAPAQGDQKIPPPPPAPTAFTQGIWADRILPTPAYRDPARERVRFYQGGKVVPIDQAETIYISLTRTPFVSLYGSSNWSDDLAEYVAVYDWTQVLKQPYRIVIRKAGDKGKPVFVYEPMKSDLVRARIDKIKQFYEKGS